MLSFTLERQEPPTTACTCHIITKNDANTIIDSLESAVTPGIFSEILILIDTSSEDATGKIISAYRAKYPEIRIVGHKWSTPPDFAEARNRCISLTRTPYAFWLDGDEILREPAQIRAMLSRASGQAFLMWIISPLGNGYFNMFQPRLFPVKPGVFFECPVLERLDWSLERAGVPVERTSATPIHHPGYVDTVQLKKKNIRNVRIMAKFLKEYRVPDYKREHITRQYMKLRGRR